jgi:hypothetical protein
MLMNNLNSTLNYKVAQREEIIRLTLEKLHHRQEQGQILEIVWEMNKF